MDWIENFIKRAGDSIHPEMARVFVDISRRMLFVSDGFVAGAAKLVKVLSTSQPINTDDELLAKVSKPIVDPDKCIVSVPFDTVLINAGLSVLEDKGYVCLEVYKSDVKDGFVLVLSQEDRHAVVMSLNGTAVGSRNWWKPFVGKRESTNSLNTKEDAEGRSPGL